MNTRVKNLIPNTNIRKTEGGMVSVVDVIKELTGKSGNTASKVVERIRSASPEISTKLSINTFGKGRPTPVADRETIINIMQMLPGIAGDKFRKATAKLVLQYLNADIRLADDIIQRTNDPEKLAWIAARAKGKETRNKFTSTLAKHGVNREGFRDCTNAIYKPLFGGAASLVRKKVGVPDGENPRDAMNTLQLGAVMLAEQGAEQIIEKQNRRGNWECENACLSSSEIVKEAIIKINQLANSPRRIGH